MVEHGHLREGHAKVSFDVFKERRLLILEDFLVKGSDFYLNAASLITLRKRKIVLVRIALDVDLAEGH